MIQSDLIAQHIIQHFQATEIKSYGIHYTIKSGASNFIIYLAEQNNEGNYLEKWFDRMTMLNHPHILKVHNDCILKNVGGSNFTAVKCEGFLPEQQLGHFVSRGFSEKAILEVIFQIASALRYMEETHGFVHGSIGVENIFFRTVEPATGTITHVDAALGFLQDIRSQQSVLIENELDQCSVETDMIDFFYVLKKMMKTNKISSYPRIVQFITQVENAPKDTIHWKNVILHWLTGNRFMCQGSVQSPAFSVTTGEFVTVLSVPTVNNSNVLEVQNVRGETSIVDLSFIKTF